MMRRTTLAHQHGLAARLAQAESTPSPWGGIRMALLLGRPEDVATT
jgi:hypothetical protein